MFARALAVLAVLATNGNKVSLAQDEVTAKVGDYVVLELTDQVATEYRVRTGATSNDKDSPHGLSIETTGTITRKLDDGRFRVEHTTPVFKDGKAVRLVTLTANVEPSTITTDITPKNTAAYASPAGFKNAAEPILTTKNARSHRVTLSDINKGVKLSEWKLVEEVGDWRLLLERK